MNKLFAFHCFNLQQQGFKLTCAVFKVTYMQITRFLFYCDENTDFSAKLFTVKLLCTSGFTFPKFLKQHLTFLLISFACLSFVVPHKKQVHLLCSISISLPNMSSPNIVV